MKKIFIACPISKYIDGNNFINNDFKFFIENMYETCQKFAPEVFLALRREEYGEKLMTNVCTELDFNEMNTTDLVVAIPDDSMGVAIELGWASCMKKKIILIINKNQRYTPLITGLKDITNTEIIWYNGQLNNEILFEVEKIVNKLSKD